MSSHSRLYSLRQREILADSIFGTLANTYFACVSRSELTDSVHCGSLGRFTSALVETKGTFDKLNFLKRSRMRPPPRHGEFN